MVVNFVNIPVFVCRQLQMVRSILSITEGPLILTSDSLSLYTRQGLNIFNHRYAKKNRIPKEKKHLTSSFSQSTLYR